MKTQIHSIGAQYWRTSLPDDTWHPTSYIEVHRSIMQTYTHLNLFIVHGRLMQGHPVWTKGYILKRTTYHLQQEPRLPLPLTDAEKEEAIQHGKHILATTPKEK